MEPLHVLALVVFVSLLSVAVTLELLGTFRFAAYLRGLFKRRPPTGSS